MTQVFERQRFGPWTDRKSGRTFSDLAFRDCTFVSCAISVTLDPRKRSTVRRVRLTGCENVGGEVWGAILDDVVVDGLKTNDLFMVHGAAFRHVLLRGRIGRLMLNPKLALATAAPAQQAAFDRANAAFYQGVDWAIDIREARFSEAHIRRVPAHLIRRDPETQVVITRQDALAGRWREVDLSGTYWRTSIEFFLNDPLAEDLVLVAPKRSRRFQRLLEGLLRLRDAGIAEPD